MPSSTVHGINCSIGDRTAKCNNAADRSAPNHPLIGQDEEK